MTMEPNWPHHRTETGSLASRAPTAKGYSWNGRYSSAEYERGQPQCDRPLSRRCGSTSTTYDRSGGRCAWIRKTSGRSISESRTIQRPALRSSRYG